MTKGILPSGRKFKNPLMGEVARNAILPSDGARARRAVRLSQGAGRTVPITSVRGDVPRPRRSARPAEPRDPSPCGTSFSTATIAASATTHAGSSPRRRTATASAPSSSPRNRRRAASPRRSAPVQPGRQCRLKNCAGDRHSPRHAALSGESW